MALQNNPYKLTSQVSLAPDPQLASMMEHYKGSGDAVSFSVVFNEVQRRKEIRDAAQSKMSGGPKQKVADQLIQEAKQAQMPARPQGQPQGGPPQGGPPQGGPPQGGPPPDMGMGPQGGPPQEGPPPDMAMGPQEGGPPQGMADGGYLLPEDTGIAQLPARNLENMAGGGLVSFAYGGDIPGYAGGEGSDIDEEAPEEEYPRLDSRGNYRANLDRINADQEKLDRDYETGRKGLGEAYANAEARDKEMTQRYFDEERSVKGQALMNFGLNLMQSGNIGAAGLAALPQYISGRKELSSRKDKQRDYMQTVAEARRAEKLGLLKDIFSIDADRYTQRIAQAGTEAELGERAADRASSLAVAEARAAGRGRKDTPSSEAGEYLNRARKDRDAADDPKNAEFREAYLKRADEHQARALAILYGMQGVEPEKAAAQEKSVGGLTEAINAAIIMLRNPNAATQAQGEWSLKVISGATGVSVEELKARFGVSAESGGGAGGGAPVGRWEDAPEDE